MVRIGDGCVNETLLKHAMSCTLSSGDDNNKEPVKSVLITFIDGTDVIFRDADIEVFMKELTRVGVVL